MSMHPRNPSEFTNWNWMFRLFFKKACLLSLLLWSFGLAYVLYLNVVIIYTNSTMQSESDYVSLTMSLMDDGIYHGGNKGNGKNKLIERDVDEKGMPICKDEGRLSISLPKYQKDFFTCQNIIPSVKCVLRGRFVALSNFIIASNRFLCNESVTYTTHGDFRYLDNLQFIIERWSGPISIALYIPGTDLEETLIRINHLRNCSTFQEAVRERVTFHLFFDKKFLKYTLHALYSNQSQENFTTNCQEEPIYSEDFKTYRLTHKLLYPVNVGRNIARLSSTTHFLLASDIELYPSYGIVESFIRMLKRRPIYAMSTLRRPRVFVLPIFEVEEGAQIPLNKTELVSLIRNNSAFPFHQKICEACHLIPKYYKWVNKTSFSSEVYVFADSRRTGNFASWEPIYIGSNREPVYDERLSWEGQQDKMSQGYILCSMDYNFAILDNAFLVHRPGIKQPRNETKKISFVRKKQGRIIQRYIKKEILKHYGVKRKCHL